MDPFQALAKTIIGIYEGKAIQKWVALLFELIWSGGLTFLFSCGSALIAKAPPGIAIGTGMVLSAITMTVVFRRSPLTKGLLLVLPSAEALKEIATDVQTIQR